MPEFFVDKFNHGVGQYHALAEKSEGVHSANDFPWLRVQLFVTFYGCIEEGARIDKRAIAVIPTNRANFLL